MDITSREHIEKGLQALRNDDTLLALMHLEKAAETESFPALQSALAYCLARERRQFRTAQQLCRAALREEPGNPAHYYQLGRIYLLAQQKKQAIQMFRKGLKRKRYQPIIDMLHQLGLRRDPVFATLDREHFLNRTAGKLLARIGRP